MNLTVALSIAGIILCIFLSSVRSRLIRSLALLGIGFFLVCAASRWDSSSPGVPGSGLEGAGAQREQEVHQEVQQETQLPYGLEANFIDVGQGLSVLLRVEEQWVLYDGGGRETAPAVIKLMKDKGIEKLDYIIASHYDADHIGGLIEILYEFEADHVLGPEYNSGSAVQDYFMRRVKQSGKKLESPKPGDTYALGDGQLLFLAPTERPYEDNNNESLVVRLVYGENEILLTGDAEAESEADMVSGGIPLSADILVAGHHGSASSTTTEFLKQIDPSYAVISCSRDNTFGHPHRSLLNRLKKAGVQIFRTDEQGTITAYGDKKEIYWSTSPSISYEPGEFES